METIRWREKSLAQRWKSGLFSDDYGNRRGKACPDREGRSRGREALEREQDVLEARNLVEQMQFFARLETDSAAGSDRHFGSGSWVASDAGFARLYAEDAKSAQLDAIACGESILHAEEDGIDGRLGLDPG